MNTKELLEKATLPTLLAVYFNTIQKIDGSFAVLSNYRSTKFNKNPLTKLSYLDTAKRLSKKYGLDFRTSSSNIIEAVIENERNLGLDDFLEDVYFAILPKMADTKDFDIEFATALFVFRGSADFKFSFYSVDLKNTSTKYVDNLFKLLLSTDELLSRLNLNFRELQPQYVGGEVRRNTQIRVNLKWYYDKVISANNLNQYKTDAMRENVTLLGEMRKPGAFVDRWAIYRELVIGRKLSEKEVDSLRESLEFSKSEIEEHPEEAVVRNSQLAAYVRETFDDVCAGCSHRFNIDERSFKMPRNDRYYFEVNHVIAFASGSKAVDVVDNLVKLCPACHRALTPRRAYPELQKEIIKNELESRPEVKKFVMSMMPNKSSSPVEFVFSRLK